MGRRKARYNRPGLLRAMPLPGIRVAALGVVSVLAACASGPNVASGSPAPSTSVSAAATSQPAGYRVLLTTSTISSSEVFLYDSASNAPQQLASLGAGPAPEAHFISSQKIAYVDSTNPMSARIMSVDLSTRASTIELAASGNVPAFAYSHDGASLAYLLHGSADGKASLHVRRGGQEKTLALNPIVGRGVGRDDELRLEYAPDDKYLLMVDTFVGNQGQAPETGQFLVLRSADNTVAFLPPAGVSSNATMATWARRSDRLYYRDAIGVRTWDAGSTSVGTLVTALHWYDPAVSADDRDIAYTEFDTQFVPHVKILDLQSNHVSPTASAPRSHPILVTAATLWYLEEQPCQSECLAGPSQSSGRVFAYTLTSKSETSLPFTDVHNLSQLAVASR